MTKKKNRESRDGHSNQKILLGQKRLPETMVNDNKNKKLKVNIPPGWDPKKLTYFREADANFDPTKFRFERIDLDHLKFLKGEERVDAIYNAIKEIDRKRAKALRSERHLRRSRIQWNGGDLHIHCHIVAQYVRNANLTLSDLKDDFGIRKSNEIIEID